MECSGVCVWRHAKPPQSCWGVYFCKPCRLRLAITIMRKSLGACRAHLPGYRYACWHTPNPPSFSQVGGEHTGTPCLNRRHHIGRWAGQDMLGHVMEPLAASMPRKHAWVQTCMLIWTRTPNNAAHAAQPIRQVRCCCPGGSLGPSASHSSACSSQAGDGWERWHIPLTGDGSSSYLICHWVQREEEEPEKIKNALNTSPGTNLWGGNMLHQSILMKKLIWVVKYFCLMLVFKKFLQYLKHCEVLLLLKPLNWHISEKRYFAFNHCYEHLFAIGCIISQIIIWYTKHLAIL